MNCSKCKNLDDLRLYIVKGFADMTNSVNLLHRLEGEKDSHLHISYEPCSRKIEVGGLNTVKRRATLEVTKW